MLVLNKEHEKYFKRFHVKSLLGKGSYGTVYNVQDKLTNENFALKEVHINLKNPNNFINELLPFNTSHPNILYYSPLMISKRPIKLNKEKLDIEKKWETNRQNIDFYEQLTVNNLENKDKKYEQFSSPDIQCIENIKLIDKEDKKFSKMDIKCLNTEETRIVSNHFISQRHLNIKRTRNWGIKKQLEGNLKVKRIKSANDEYFLYLKTKICSFSLRDFLDVRNKIIFNKDTKNYKNMNITYEGLLDTKVEIPISFYNESIKNDKISRAFSMRIFRCILLGLLFLHSLGISHNDLKSSNIFLDGNDGYIPKIGDFGSKTICKKHKEYNNKLYGNSDYFYYDDTEKIECEHQNNNKVLDCKALVPILIELLFPFKTHAEMVNVIRTLKETYEVPDFIRTEFPEESELIESILKDKNISVKTILTATYKILDVI
ncbi:eukaryotic translation initiation factor 2-alpha kinase 1 [Vairimorpha necatrix]|uniref:non-specific serine/threonine protein kinase n=1 Tax=Vairimorpha necatrix TaxID=6039 RepID=A0AAX4JG90_9MICR